MKDDIAQPNSNMQSMQCNVCQKVNMADGTQVWVCKECGTEHQPGEAPVADPAAAGAQAVVDQAASVPAGPDATKPTQ